MRSVCIIPARFGSTRLRGKPLKDICGRPMFAWVYGAAVEAGCFETVVIATDSERIYSECKKLGIEVLMTRDDHPTAIHRLYEVSRKVQADYYVQLNGDEPIITPHTISMILPNEDELSELWGTNIISPIHDPVELMDSSNIKVVFNENMECIYMSRNAVPYPFKTLSFHYYKHIGVIGYSPRMLRFYVSSEPGRLEMIEGIDLLRFIDYGKKLKLTIDSDCKTLSVDTEKDLEKVRRLLRSNMAVSV